MPSKTTLHKAIAFLILEMKSQPKQTKKDPVLTYANIIQKALEHRKQHNIHSTDLGVICGHMARTTNFIPSVAIMLRGLTIKHYDKFAKHARETTITEKTHARQSLTETDKTTQLKWTNTPTTTPLQ